MLDNTLYHYFFQYHAIFIVKQNRFKTFPTKLMEKIFAFSNFNSVLMTNQCIFNGLYMQYPDRYSNLFLNAYINRHVYAEYLKWSNSIVL